MERDTSSTPAAPLSLRERKRAEARARTIDVAMALFADRGYEAVTVNDICAAAEIAPRTFFRYFPTKEDVVLEPVRTMAGRVEAFLESAPEGWDVPTVLRAAMRDLGTHVVADDGRVLAALSVVASADVVRSSPVLVLAGRERALAAALARRGG
ncbi:TetR/AcrR family transcriptional regulator, partial [Patulibacter sp. S7RM1-6]